MKLDIQLFSSTNKTTHYNLSQYVSSDKPTYLVDYNDDMSAIDTAIYNAKTQADLGVTNASTAQTTAENAQTTANTAVTNASSAQTDANTAIANVGTLANLETAAKTSSVAAINEVVGNVGNKAALETTDKTSIVNAINEVIDFIHLTNTTTYNVNDILKSGASSFDGNITIKKDSTGKVFKIYGAINTVNPDGNIITLTISNTGLHPTTNMSFSEVGISLSNTSQYKYPRRPEISVAPNGTVTITCFPLEDNINSVIILFENLYVVE